MRKKFTKLIALVSLTAIVLSMAMLVSAQPLTNDNIVDTETQIVSIIESQEDTAAVGNQNSYRSSSGSSSSRSSSSSSRSSSSRSYSGSGGSYSSSGDVSLGGIIFFRPLRRTAGS